MIVDSGKVAVVGMLVVYLAEGVDSNSPVGSEVRDMVETSPVLNLVLNLVVLLEWTEPEVAKANIAVEMEAQCKYYIVDFWEEKGLVVLLEALDSYRFDPSSAAFV
jgi:hypothetical protein